ncbi:sigma-54 interaction domain-containing protein [Desulfatitalea tepidiphila]|uniref:sigma-54 interaction domain-containing protein n=1 Tax=Desulfatitalea tepidiphila TaxID=1185843 RepID=UPI0006B58789|nr:sigma 54-interacting transcriptional regulator [Desulfatitalea tepidiphila]
MLTDTGITNENDLLQKIMQGTAGAVGASFFRALVKNLSHALGTHGAWITEYRPDTGHLHALAFWMGNGFVDHYEYDLAGTPCENTIKNKTHLHIPDNVVRLFPGDPDLAAFNAVSYMGFPLIGPDDQVLGNLAVLDTKRMPESYRNLALFRIFAARATAEMLRLRAEAGMRAREETLSGVFNGAMDAIIELDHAFHIVILNPAAGRMFGCGRDSCTGRSFGQLIAKEDFQRLQQIVRTLDAHSDSKRSIWVPDGLNALGPNRLPIRTEATLSLIEIHGRPGYVLILRDVNERFEARRQIESLRDEAAYLKGEIQQIYDFGQIIGQSQPFRETLELVAEVAPTDSTVLIIGETGTGKELIARAIHAASSRKEGPLITVNCAAIPDMLMESEFFGHEKGAFTGATQRREGRFGLADRGTLFLDEVGELNRELQAKLLRVLQEGEFTPVGGSSTRRVDVRIIAATNRDLSRAVGEGRFRTDLFYRLNVFPIRVPPLREREADIGLLAEHFAAKYAARMKRTIAPLSTEVIEKLKGYDWPGNVRELQNVIERGVITARHGHLRPDPLLPRRPAPPPDSAPPADGRAHRRVRTVRELRELERGNILLAMEKSRWRVSGRDGAARLLDMPASTLQSRMKALGIQRPPRPNG